jgi:hypothetical protein
MGDSLYRTHRLHFFPFLKERGGDAVEGVFGYG